MNVFSKRFLLTGLMALAVCASASAADKDKKKDAPKEPSKPAAAPSGPTSGGDSGVIAMVGDTRVTDSDLMASLPQAAQTQLQGAMQRVADIERNAVQASFAKKYAEQQAAAKGISEDEYYKGEIAANRESFPNEFKTQIAQAKSQLYDGKKAALDDMIGKKLEENAAKARGVTVDALVKAEVEDKIPAVSQAEIDQFYTQNQRQFGTQAKEAVSPQISEMIKRNKLAQKRNEFRSTLRASTKVRTMLEVPRVPVDGDDDPLRGSKDAPVKIVLFSDFQCPFCSRVEATLKQVMDRYGDKVSVVFRDYPLSFHPFAEKASEAANCAHRQGKYWEFHDALFANQSALAVPDLKKQAETLKLDMSTFNQCLDSGEMKAEIDKDEAAGVSFGVNGTPASFINGRLLSGAQPFEGFARVIDDELQMMGIPVPPASGTTPK